MPDYTRVFLSLARKVAGCVYEQYYRNVECITESYESGLLVGTVHAHAACTNHWLVGYNPDGLAVQPGKAYYDLIRKLRFHLKKISIVNNFPDDPVHVITSCWLSRDNLSKLVGKPFRRITGIFPCRFFSPVGRKE